MSSIFVFLILPYKIKEIFQKLIKTYWIKDILIMKVKVKAKDNRITQIFNKI